MRPRHDRPTTLAVVPLLKCRKKEKGNGKNEGHSDKFGLESREDTTQTRVIVVETEGRLMGLVVDFASQVVSVAADQIDPPPPVPGGFDSFLTVEEKMALSSIDAAPSVRVALQVGSPRQEC